MKLRNTLFFSITLLLAMPQGILAMYKYNDDSDDEYSEAKESFEAKDSSLDKDDKKSTEDKKDDKPAGEQGWFRKKWDGLSTPQRVAAGVGAGALGVGAAATVSSSLRGTLRSWCIDPFVNKYKAIQQNGFVKELITKPMLGTYALAGGLGYGLYKWRSLSEDDRKKKVEDTKAWVSENKGKVILGAGVVAAALLYKNMTAAQPSSSLKEQEDLLQRIDPKLQEWFDKTWQGFTEVQRITIFQNWVKPDVLWTFISKEQQAEVQAQFNKLADVPYLFLLNSLSSEQVEALRKEITNAAFFAPNDLIMNSEHRTFINCLTQVQKAELLAFIKEHNKACFEVAKVQFAQTFSIDEVLNAKILAAKDPKELLALVESREAQEALIKTAPIVPDAPAIVKALTVNFKLISSAFAAQEAFEMAQNQRPITKAEELRAIYTAEVQALVESLSKVQTERLGVNNNIEEALLKNPMLIVTNPAAMAVLDKTQIATLESLVKLFNEIQVATATR